MLHAITTYLGAIVLFASSIHPDMGRLRMILESAGSKPAALTPEALEFLSMSAEDPCPFCFIDPGWILAQLSRDSGNSPTLNVMPSVGHTFIIECLWRGVPVSEIAAIAGNSPRIIEQHHFPVGSIPAKMR